MNRPEIGDDSRDDTLPAVTPATANERRNDKRVRLHPTTSFPIAATATALLFVATFTVMALSSETVRQAPSQEPAPADQVLASFERELNREPVPARPATREFINDDVLYRTMNAAHWTEYERMERALESCDQSMPGLRVHEFGIQAELVEHSMRRCLAREISSR